MSVDEIDFTDVDAENVYRAAGRYDLPTAKLLVSAVARNNNAENTDEAIKAFDLYYDSAAGEASIEYIDSEFPEYSHVFSKEMKERIADSAGQVKKAKKRTGKGSFKALVKATNARDKESVAVLKMMSDVTNANIVVYGDKATDAPNGRYESSTDTIYINLYGEYPALYTAAHELTHWMRERDEDGYQALKNYILEKYEQIDTKDKNALEILVQRRRAMARANKENPRELSFDDAVEEIVADACQLMLKDSTAIQELAGKQPSLMKSIKKWLDGFVKTLKAAFANVPADVTSVERKWLEYVVKDMSELQRLWDKALVGAAIDIENGAIGAKAFPSNKPIKYSDSLDKRIMDENTFNPKGIGLQEQLNEILNTADSFDNRYLYIGRFSGNLIAAVNEYLDKRDLFTHVKVQDLPVVMNYRDAYLAMENKENGKYHGDNISYHNLNIDGMIQVINNLNAPDTILLSKNDGKIEIVLGVNDYKGYPMLLIIKVNTVAQNAEKYIKCHVMASAYGKRSITNYINKADIEGRVIYDKKMNISQGITQVQYKSDINDKSSSSDSISNPPEIVNENSENPPRKDSDRSRDSEGRELSPGQVEYFKDSKVVDRNGNLSVVYHNTNNEFTVFDLSRSGSNQGQSHGDGVYLSTNNYDYAAPAYGTRMMRLYANITNPFDMNMSGEEADFVLDNYASKKHNLDKFDGLYRNHAHGKLTDSGRVIDYLKEYAEDNEIKTSDILKDLGYDGIRDGEIAVAFSPNQIKSVDNLNPTEDDDIRYSDRSDESIDDFWFGDDDGGEHNDYELYTQGRFHFNLPATCWCFDLHLTCIIPFICSNAVIFRARR